MTKDKEEVGLTECSWCGKKAQVFMYAHSATHPYRCDKCENKYHKRQYQLINKTIDRTKRIDIPKTCPDKYVIGYLRCAIDFGLITMEQAEKLLAKHEDKNIWNRLIKIPDIYHVPLSDIYADRQEFNKVVNRIRKR